LSGCEVAVQGLAAFADTLIKVQVCYLLRESPLDIFHSWPSGKTHLITPYFRVSHRMRSYFPSLSHAIQAVQGLAAFADTLIKVQVCYLLRESPLDIFHRQAAGFLAQWKNTSNYALFSRLTSDALLFSITEPRHPSVDGRVTFNVEVLQLGSAEMPRLSDIAWVELLVV
jgi:hypothetical protein